jgi:hypothetical protein
MKSKLVLHHSRRVMKFRISRKQSGERTSAETARRERSAHVHAPSRPALERHEDLLRLQRTHGNRAVQRLLSGPKTPLQVQRAPAPPTTTTAPAAAPDPETKTLTPLEQAQALVQESPASVKDRAAWILKAADQGFVTFNTNKARANLEDVRDEKKVENLDPKAAGYDVPILEVEVGLARDVAQRWIDAKGAGAKPSIQFGSMIRSGTADPHAKGKAIDINALNMTAGVDATVMILNDLDKSIDTSYGLGFPFQGDFFDPADNLEKKKKEAESSAPPIEQAKTEASAAPASKPDAAAKPAEKKESQPVTASVTDGVQKFASHIYQSSGTRGPDGKWTWKDTIQEAGGAYKKLKSKTLKDTLASRRQEGFSFTIFPDNDNHLHLDVR